MPIKPAKKKRDRGISRLSKEAYDGLVAHMSKGLTFESYAGVLGVTIEQLNKLLTTNSKFKKAYQIGSAKSMLFWEQVGMASMLGIKSVKDSNGAAIPIGAINSQSWQFVMKSRFGYNEKAGKDPNEKPDIVIDLPESFK